MRRLSSDAGDLRTGTGLRFAVADAAFRRHAACKRNRMTNYHITPHGDGWKLTAEGSDKVIDIFRTKEDGLQVCGDLIMERDGGMGSLKVHHKDGTIAEERTYPRSADPRQSPG